MASSPPPQIPPLPADFHPQRPTQSPPTVPPLPPNYYYSQQPREENQPHFADALAAPRAHRLDPGLPAHMARTLDEQLRGPSPQAPPLPYPGQQQQQQPQALQYPQHVNSNPGFAFAPAPTAAQAYAAQVTAPNNPISLPHPQPLVQPLNPQRNSARFSPPPITADANTLASSMANLSFQQPYQQQQSYPQQQPYPPQQQQQQQPQYQPYPPQQQQQSYPQQPYPPQQTRSPQPPQLPPSALPLPGVPSLTQPLPTPAELVQHQPAPNADAASKLGWARDVVWLVERMQGSGAEPSSGPAAIPDVELARIAPVAVQIVLALAGEVPLVAEAVYLRATFAASGAYPGQVAQNPRTAFRDFEAAARGGYSPAWFRLGRDYENFSDFAHAKDCFERGAKAGVESCVYRLGMASLLGQLGIPPSPAAALPHLARAAALATTRVPQPAYVYALLLLNEFTQVSIDPREFAGYIPPGGSAGAEARKHLERAAFLNFAPAQYKLGHCYEFAQPPPFPFDPLLSVQYYSLASQQGEDEADMALSKWFLCGSEGAFPKDEDLAYTFAEKAAVRGLGSAEFAMGYYAEVGVGPVKDVEAARAWYTKAAEHGNTDANDRLVALGAPGNAPLSRQQHDDITETKLVRKRTQARERSSGERDRPPSDRQGVDGRRIVENVRRGSMDQRPGPGPPAGAPMAPIAESPRMRPQQPPQQQGGYPQQPPPGQQRPPQQAYSPPPGQQRPPQQAYSPPPGQQRPPPQAGQQRAFPGQNRYSLVDSPVPSPPPGQRPSPAPSQAHAPRGRGGPGGQGRGRGGPQGPHANSMPPPPQQAGYPAQPPLQHMQSFPGPGPAPQQQQQQPPRKQGATTFAEMGITAAKAEDKECVIM